METICVNCGLLLLDRRGVMRASANYDSSLPSAIPRDKKKQSSITYARCDECVVVARKVKALRQKR